MMWPIRIRICIANASPENRVTHELAKREDLYIVGYMARHTGLSRDDQELVTSALRGESGGRRIDTVLDSLGEADAGRYVGAIDKFVNGSNYEFIFGVTTGSRLRTLPDGVVCRKVRAGEWAVYNSSAGDYQSIWKHFTDMFYGIEQRGYDISLIPFECYETTGRFSDVHIPVDLDMPADSGHTVTTYYRPDTTEGSQSMKSVTIRWQRTSPLVCVADSAKPSPRTCEVVQLPPQRAIGKLEAPPISVVTDDDKKRFYALPGNEHRGSYIIGYTLVQPPNAGVYYDKPLIKGVLAAEESVVPDGL